jgi:opacity protein-like surface antigen
LLACAVPAHAQSWEISGLFGYTPKASIDQVAPELNAVDVNGGITWGAQVARFLSPHWGAEALWMQQRTGLGIESASGSATLFDFTAGQLHGDIVYRFSGAQARLQPFAFAGLGATFFRADDVPSETKLSLGLGGGVKYFLWRNVGVRGHFRYKPTLLNDDNDDFCDPFGFCQNTLQQVEVAVGAVVRF